MTALQIIEKLRDANPTVRTRFNVNLIALFGSYAREEQRADSDMDLIYQSFDDYSFGLNEITGLEDYIKDLFNVPAVDLVDKDYINPVIEMEIQNELIYV
ncbi:MAG: nucleotidyltransferase domain-containing protein [Saprospiraceae bacterium]